LAKVKRDIEDLDLKGVEVVQEKCAVPQTLSIKRKGQKGTFGQLVHMDVSHEPLPFVDDSFNVVFCTETIEHVANPYFAVAEIKRVLEHDGLFVLAFPMPEDNLGYGGGQHGHVYPGFLLRESFERFMMQLYFRAPCRQANGSSAWYAYRNAKQGGKMVDIFSVIAGNYTEEELYGWL
jgi:SAM-dependent methyltransferase